jgi:hypothetical protein
VIASRQCAHWNMFATTSDTPVPSRAARIFTAWAMGAVRNIETLTLSSLMGVNGHMTVGQSGRLGCGSPYLIRSKASLCLRSQRVSTVHDDVLYLVLD